MIKLSIVLLLTAFLLTFSNAQVQTEIFYKDKYKSKVLEDEKGAKYKEVTSISVDFINTILFYRIKSKKMILLSERKFKNGNQVGIWKYYDKNGNLDSTVDYSTPLKYIDHKFESPNYISFERDEVISLNDNMIPPKILDSKNIFYALYGNLKYPAYARKNGIQGEVLFNCRISKDGKFEILGILESSHPILEKAAWLGLSHCSNWIPAQIGEDKVDSYFVMPVKFKLEG